MLLVDGSRSMQVADSLGDKSRWDAMKLLLDAAAGDLAKLDETWDVTAYEFDDDDAQARCARRQDLPLAAAPTGEQSAVGAAINDALDRETSGRVLAMLLLSDGAQRAVPPHDLPPQVAARRLAAENIPLYTFTFGKSGGSERADLAIDDLVTNETIFAETPTEVRGQLTRRRLREPAREGAAAVGNGRRDGSRRHGASRHGRRRRHRCPSCCGTRRARRANTK